ncbi:hypothetical protein V6N13_006316 [Hibiscus sabdariffa]
MASSSSSSAHGMPPRYQKVAAKSRWEEQGFFFDDAQANYGLEPIIYKRLSDPYGNAHSARLRTTRACRTSRQKPLPQLLHLQPKITDNPPQPHPWDQHPHHLHLHHLPSLKRQHPSTFSN